jgi:hypothetical protein
MPRTGTNAPLRERLLRSIEVDDNGCWVWQLSKDKDGYGWVGIARKKTGHAHRASYTVFKGEIPAGLTIDHLCRNRACINPDHLEAVPHGVNVLRGDAPTARNARATHCIHGHEFTEANTYINKGNGQRVCRKCSRIRSNRRYHEVIKPRLAQATDSTGGKD